jgi:CBS domain-containing protein
LITGSIAPLKPSDKGAYALSQMEEFRVSHLPVVEGSEYLGLISDTDILSANDPEVSLSHFGLTLDRAGISENQHVYDVIRMFTALKLTVLPVLTEKGHYLGLITQPALIDYFASITAIHNPGGVIVLELNEKDYDLVEIAQIVESNDNKILSLSVTSFPDSTKIEVTLKLNRIDIGPVLQTFFRYDYLVKASWSDEDAYSQGLQDRFDGLMNYLNI